MNKYSNLDKLALIKAAASHIRRSRLIKQAYGAGDDFGYIERIPNEFIDNKSVESLVEGLKFRLKELKKQRKQLYDLPIYKGYAPDDMYVSKYRQHTDETGATNEMSYEDYAKLVANAIKKKDKEALEDAARYFSYRADITDPEKIKKLQPLIDKWRKEQEDKGEENTAITTKTKAKDNLAKSTIPKGNITVGYGGMPAQVLGSSLGRLNMAFNPMTYILTPSMLVNPTNRELDKDTITIDPKDKKARMYEELAKRMAKSNPAQLSDVHVNLGGGRFLNDTWRTLTNSRLNPVLRLLGVPVTLYNDFQAAMLRSDHYNPLNNTVTLFSDSPAILTHELGHAIDLNSYSIPRDDEKESKQSFFPRMGTKLVRHIRNLPRDAYSLLRGVPGIPGIVGTMTQESMANLRSRYNLEDAFKDDPETLKALMALRNKHLNPAYTTYIASTASKLGTPITYPLLYGGMLGAKLLGEADNAVKGDSQWETTAYHKVMDALTAGQKVKETKKKPIDFEEAPAFA